MKAKNLWVDISLLNLCIVALLGFILRSKILFSVPWINYLSLLDAHFHFAFEGWVTLSLFYMLVNELLPGSITAKPVYNWLFSAFLVLLFGVLISTLLDDNSLSKDLFSYCLIIVTYIFSWIFLKDLLRLSINKTVLLLSVSAIISLVLSSLGPIASTYLHTIKSHDPFLYRDTQYIFLHLQYNGFFPLTIFALVLHDLYPKISIKSQQSLYRFSVLLCLSLLPSLFLSFLWQNPNDLFRSIALAGSILIFISVVWFIVSVLPLLKYSKLATSSARYIFFLSIAAFILKMLLQSLTIFTVIGNAVFGDRPVIIGFLHLVLLGFVSSFILADYSEKRFLDVKFRITAYAVFIFILSIIINEILLMLQGLGAMILRSSYLFPWLLWIISICLLAGAILIFAARIKSKKIL